MKETTINVRIDKKTKDEFEAVCKELGINITTAISIFAKKVGREKRIPFKLSIKKNKTLQAIEDVENSVNLSETFENVDDLMKDLNA